MKELKEKSLCLLVGMLALAADQVSKHAVQNLMAARDGREITVIKGFFSIVLSYNTGIAFGLFKGMPSLYLYLPILLVVIMLVFFLRLERKRFVTIAGLGLMMGGAIGNLVDRLRTGGQVFDFLDVYVGDLHWPTFNAADSFIVIGVFLFAAAMIRGERDA